MALPAEKEASQRAVLYLPDIIGIWQNSKLMADAFARQGYACLVLDLFNGDPAPLNMPEDFDIMKWLQEGTGGKNPHTSETIDPIVVSGINYLKGLGITKIAAAGYCFGAKVRFHTNFTLRSMLIPFQVCRASLQERDPMRLHRPPVLCGSGRARRHHRTAIDCCGRV